MQQRHRDPTIIFEEQKFTVSQYILPLIAQFVNIGANKRILEVGFGVGGNMSPFVEKELSVVGVDLNANKLKVARKKYAEHTLNGQVVNIEDDIYNLSPALIGKFDIIFLKDTIEHIYDQGRFLIHIRNFLKRDGILFISFPPYYMPFGGHQQICSSPFLSKSPYIHLLPNKLYTLLLQVAGESSGKIDVLLNIKTTGISIDRLKRLFKFHQYQTLYEAIYLINPNYEIKFGLKPKLQLSLISKIAHLRSIISTCAYYIVRAI